MIEERKFVILSGKRRDEEISGGDLVWVIAPHTKDIHDRFYFFKNIISQGNIDVVELEYIDGMDVGVPMKTISGLEIIAHKGTRQYEVLVAALLQNHHLKIRIKKIEQNFTQLLCME